MIRGRLRRLRGGEGDQQDQLIEIDPGEFSGVFAAPRWLRDAGFTSWLLVGVTLFVVGVVWLLSLTHSIFMPLVAAGVIAAVAGAPVSLLRRHGLPRGLGAALVMLLLVAAGALATFLILDGITSESGAIGNELEDAAGEIEGWLKDLGVSDGKAEAANHDASTAASDSYKALIQGAAGGISKLSSVVFFLAMTAVRRSSRTPAVGV